jgi:threonine aldolase
MTDYQGIAGASSIDRSSGNSIIDFRSDTVTMPGAAMREAMACADVGDDVYSDDPTVNALEERAARLLGKEAALFLTSGSQSNLVALLTHCGRGDEYIGGNGYHISRDEAGGAAVLGGVSPLHLPINAKGGLSVAQVEAAIKPDNVHYARTRLVCLENTVDGKVQDQVEIDAIADMAHARGLVVHLDGARLMNAAVASGKSAAALAKSADSVSLCLSKGLGAPVGSVLGGSKEFIHLARYNRKLLGGGMRQAGILAAAGLYAFEHNIERMAEDHARTRRLAEELSRIQNLKIGLEDAETNMFFMIVPDEDQLSLQQFLQEQNIIIGAYSPEIRIVIHLDIDDQAIDRMIDAMNRYYS